MSRLPLAYFGAPILRRKAEEVQEITHEIRQLVADMWETMEAEDGIGLAANQVFSKWRIFITASYERGEDNRVIWGPKRIFINPRLKDPSEEEEEALEGCLSIPGVHVPVARPVSVTVEAMDLEGNMFEERVSGQFARQVMHENDHLNGTLMVDRLDKKSRKSVDGILKKIKKKYGRSP